MNINQTEKDNLYKGLGLFIEAIRLYVVALLQEKHGNDWANAFAETLYDDQKLQWQTHLQNGAQPESLIDFNHLKSFAIKNKDLLKRDFGGKTNKLGTWFDEINEVRNQVAHHQKISTLTIRLKRG
jgi:abortive infection bacteriophage resistance protein